jgi:hypothetical protein
MPFRSSWAFLSPLIGMLPDQGGATFGSDFGFLNGRGEFERQRQRGGRAAMDGEGSEKSIR